MKIHDIFFPLVPPAPDISFEYDSSAVEGEQFTLTCVAHVVEGSPTLTWRSPMGSVVNSGNGTRLDLNLESLMTSDEGTYSCDVLISIQETTVMNSRMVDITTSGRTQVHATVLLMYVHSTFQQII